ncbi:MAG: hypothetical protein ACLTBI_13920 [Romboutsia timonensis]|uniref:hypothetical protein n=2 Tax=Romboutsia timonensis TaxID=1776391 RepID=UPI003992C46D
MEELIGILLIVSPGFIVKKLKDMLIAKEKIETDVENTIVSIIYSIPILVVNLIILMFIYKIKTIQDITSKFSDLKFILTYVIVSLISIIIVGYGLIFFSKKINKDILNKFRKVIDEPERTNSLNPWQDFFKVEENMPIRIFKGGELITQGFVKHWDVDGLDEKDIVLEYQEGMKENPQCFKRVKTTYYSVINDVVIQELYFDKEFLDNN